jgi:hypothetical protein
LGKWAQAVSRFKLNVSAIQWYDFMGYKLGDGWKSRQCIQNLCACQWMSGRWKSQFTRTPYFKCPEEFAYTPPKVLQCRF